MSIFLGENRIAGGGEVSSLNTHVANTNNPHGTTRAQLGAQQNLTEITAAQGFNSQPIVEHGLGWKSIALTSYTLLIGDSGLILYFTASTSIAVTVPGGLGANFNTVMVPRNTGQITATGSGATIESYPENVSNSVKSIAKNAPMSVMPTPTLNTFLFTGITL